MPKIFKNACVIGLGLILSALYMPPISADDDPSADIIDMIVGDIQSVPANNLTRVSVTNPDVVDISDAQSEKVSLMAKKAGSTALFLWDADGKHTIRIRVASEDLGAFKARIQRILQEAGITGVSMEINRDLGKVVVTGSLSADDKNRLEDVLSPYGDNLVNFVTQEKNNDLIQVDMQIVEINTSLEKNLGIIWGNSSNASTTVSGGTSSGTSSTANSGQINLNYNEVPPTQNGHWKDFFKIGNFYRTSPLEATVNALLQEGKARLISKPRLVVVSGKQASFLVGGEIPIQSSTASTTGGTISNNTTYAQYGVNLSVTPTIKSGKIDVLLNVDIRDIDAATPISSGSGSGNNVAFVTRTATTDLLMDNKQTIALAGLIKYQDSVNMTEVPFLSKIPILGLMFRNRSEPADSNTEMVIILTPTVLTEKKYAGQQLSMPTPEVKSAWKQFDSKYEHEPIVSTWTPAQKDSVPSDILPAVTAYARTVQEKISRAISYTPQMPDNVSGTVRLRLSILKDGSLSSEEVVQSSGNDLLDQDAVQAAKTAAPFNAFTTGIDQDELVFTIPIVYNKINAGQQAENVVASY